MYNYINDHSYKKCNSYKNATNIKDVITSIENVTTSVEIVNLIVNKNLNCLVILTM